MMVLKKVFLTTLSLTHSLPHTVHQICSTFFAHLYLSLSRLGVSVNSGSKLNVLLDDGLLLNVTSLDSVNLNWDSNGLLNLVVEGDSHGLLHLLDASDLIGSVDNNLVDSLMDDVDVLDYFLWDWN